MFHTVACVGILGGCSMHAQLPHYINLISQSLMHTLQLVVPFPRLTGAAYHLERGGSRRAWPSNSSRHGMHHKSYTVFTYSMHVARTGS